MEFWGVEVKAGETVKCDPGDDKYLHLSQASLGEVKKDKGNENIPLFVKFNDQRLVIGTLSTEKCAQISYDLVFEQEFELSHNWKNGSVFFVGYQTIVSDEGRDFFEEDTDSDEGEEDLQLSQKVNGKPESKDGQPKSKANAPKADTAKPKVKVEEPKKEEDEDDDKDESDDDEDESNEDASDDEMLGDGGDSSDEEESSDEEDKATPKKTEISKKRQAESASKTTPATEKKAKLSTPAGIQKTGGADGKKGGHIATPYPAKQAAKGASTKQTPISAGSVSCKSCSKSFQSENALQAHTKAKHSGK